MVYRPWRYLMNAEHLYAVVMAGGRGSRFWPRSRKKCSKQTLNIIGNNTMIQDSVYRLSDIIGPDRIFIMTNSLLRDQILEQVPEVPPAQVIAEPASRNTAPCIGLAAVILRRRDPDAIMAAFAADHLIKDVGRFHRDLVMAASFATDRKEIVTFGVPTERPETGFGYLQAGEVVADSGNGDVVRKVRRFVEKPDVERAEMFHKDPDYYINSGMFVWHVSTILEEIEHYLPDMAAGLYEIEKNLGTPLEFKSLGEVFPDLEPVSIDYGVMEKSERVVMVAAGFGWNDIGSWGSLYDVWPKDKQGNACICRKLTIDTNNSLVYSPGKLVAVIGMHDVIIVETEDALLVCHKDRAQDVSKVIDLCRKNRMEEYL